MFSSPPAISRAELESVFIPYDLKRLEMYSRNMVDYHLIMDMVPTIARMFFLSQLGDISLSAAQSVCTDGAERGCGRTQGVQWGMCVCICSVTGIRVFSSGPFPRDWPAA